ncbi:hypothetical protein MJO28_000240 [Puccinia striiformis f. sp. tritici]|uniref:Uncharacterized protein n=1 Tax=Puccinia striiformis f. sp. tritici TaxID=168172 RepID=A0ACC0EXZ6_9BASI|nr:hypothetical protein MJO28_000240 [Puccinia striiformis f. sp. tritici]
MVDLDNQRIYLEQSMQQEKAAIPSTEDSFAGNDPFGMPHQSPIYHSTAAHGNLSENGLPSVPNVA